MNNGISVTISPEMYSLLLNGRKANKEEPGIKACLTHENVVKYVDSAFGLLGKVVEVLVG